MNAWLAAMLALLPVAAIGIVGGLRGDAANRLVAVEFGTVVVAVVAVLASFAFDQPSIVDLALALAFLTLPGTLWAAHVLERWL